MNKKHKNRSKQKNKQTSLKKKTHPNHNNQISRLEKNWFFKIKTILKCINNRD